jgi:hypothetical protein
MEDTKVCGFKNYPTFTVAIAISNNSDQYEYWQARAQEAQERAQGESTETAEMILADMLKDEYEGNAPESGDVYETFVGYALEQVDWKEVARDIVQP